LCCEPLDKRSLPCTRHKEQTRKRKKGKGKMGGGDEGPDATGHDTRIWSYIDRPLQDCYAIQEYLQSWDWDDGIPLPLPITVCGRHPKDLESPVLCSKLAIRPCSSIVVAASCHESPAIHRHTPPTGQPMQHNLQMPQPRTLDIICRYGHPVLCAIGPPVAFVICK